MNIQPITLTGTVVRLVPLSLDYFPGLCEAGLDLELWKFTLANVRTPEDMKQYIEEALEQQRQGVTLPFVITEQHSHTVVGCTRYGNIDKVHRRVEIGWTWIARPWQRTSVNTETKLLLLTHAFEQLGCIRVEFKTDSLNVRSRNALLRIGAREEGIFRNHMITPSGRIRHTVYFSIIDGEWKEVKERLRQKLNG